MQMPEWKSDPNWTHEEYMVALREHNAACMQVGVAWGWWESVDDRGNPVPFPAEFSRSEHPTMGTIMVALKVFPSVTQARKNNMDGPSQLGTYTVGRKRIRIRIVE